MIYTKENFAVDTGGNTDGVTVLYDQSQRRQPNPRKGWQMVEQKGNRLMFTEKGRVAVLGAWLSIIIPLGTLAWNSGAGYRSITDANDQAVHAALEAKEATARNAALIADLTHEIAEQRAEDTRKRADYDRRVQQMEDNIVGLGAIVGKLAAKVHVQPYVSCCIAGTPCHYGEAHCNRPVERPDGGQ